MALDRLVAPEALTASVRLLAAIGGLTLASTGECDVFFLLIFIFFFFLGIKIEQFPLLARIIGAAQPIFAGVVFLIAVIDFLYLSNSFLLSVAHFLLCLQALRILVLRTTRENAGSVLLSSMMILSASTLAVEWTFFLMLFIFLPTAIWTLMIYDISSEWNSSAQQPSSPPWRQLMPLIRNFTAVAFLITALCCAFVFVTFPRFNFKRFKGQFLQPVHKTGYTNQVDLDKGGRIQTDDSVVMRIEIPNLDPSRWPGYLRGSTLDLFDGKKWTRKATQSQRRYTVNGQITLQPGLRPNAPLVRQIVYLESMDSPILFAVPQPISAKLDKAYLDVLQDGTFRRTSGDSWRIRYEVASLPIPVDKGGTPVAATSAHLNQTTIKGLAKSLSAGLRTDVEKARRVVGYLSSNYAYTLTLENRNVRVSPIEQFLFNDKKGNCEYFAAATCLLLREMGIESRVVTGFLSNEWNERGHYFIVRMKDAHAWTEAKVQPNGWMAFDASPRELTPVNFQNKWIRELELAMDSLNLRWNRYILSYDLQQQASIVQSISENSNRISLQMGRFASLFKEKLGFEDELSTRKDNRSGRIPREIWIGLGTLAVCLSLYVALGRRQRRKLADKRSVWFYRPLLKFVERQGGSKKPAAQTLHEFIASHVKAENAHLSDVLFLEHEYYRVRFDPGASTGPEFLKTIQTSLKRLQA